MKISTAAFVVNVGMDLGLIIRQVHVLISMNVLSFRNYASKNAQTSMEPIDALVIQATSYQRLKTLSAMTLMSALQAITIVLVQIFVKTLLELSCAMKH